MSELKHYGILGMKWGVRRYQPYPKDGSPSGKFIGKKPKVDQLARDQRKKDLRERRNLTDAELEQKISRIQKEIKLYELTQDDLYPGRKFTKQVLESAGKKVAIAAVAGTTVLLGRAALKKAGVNVSAVSTIFPTPKWK